MTHSKEKNKIIDVTRGSTVILRSYDNTFCAQKENKNNDFIQFVSICPFGEYPLNVNNVCCSVSAVSYGYVVYDQFKVQTMKTTYPLDCCNEISAKWTIIIIHFIYKALYILKKSQSATEKVIAVYRNKIK